MGGAKGAREAPRKRHKATQSDPKRRKATQSDAKRSKAKRTMELSKCHTSFEVNRNAAALWHRRRRRSRDRSGRAALIHHPYTVEIINQKRNCSSWSQLFSAPLFSCKTAALGELMVWFYLDVVCLNLT